MTLEASATLFQVIIPGDQPAADPLGLWQAIPAGTSFATSEAEGVLWRAELPSDPLAASHALQFQAFQGRRLRQALDAAPLMLSRDLDYLRTSPGGPAFGIQMAGSGGALGVLEQASQRAGEGLSFSVLEDLGVSAAVEVFKQFIAQVERTVGQLALVESARGGHRLGMTQVAWSGGVHTWWGPQAGALDASQHNQILAAALATRQDWLHYLSLLTSTVLRVSVVLTLSPFNPLAIWTAWNYIQEILSSIRSRK